MLLLIYFVNNFSVILKGRKWVYSGPGACTVIRIGGAEILVLFPLTISILSRSTRRRQPARHASQFCNNFNHSSGNAKLYTSLPLIEKIRSTIIRASPFSSRSSFTVPYRLHSINNNEYVPSQILISQLYDRSLVHITSSAFAGLMIYCSCNSFSSFDFLCRPFQLI